MSVRVVRVHAPGGPDALRIDEIDLPPPAAGEARVSHTAIGVNMIDTYHRSGLYPLPMPAALGAEAAGVIEAVGEGVALPIGARVAYATAGPGAYADARNVEATKLVRVPEGVADEAAAASLLKGMTVEYLIHRTFAVARGHTVLFHAAAGGVGSLAVQWLAHLGASVIATVSTDEKAERARSLGAAHTIVYSREDFVARVREITGGRGCDVVYDSVGKDTFAGSLECLRPRGMLVGFGNASGKPGPVDPMVLAAKGSLFLTRASLFHYVATPEELALSSGRLMDAIARGAVRVDVNHRHRLAEIADVHRALEARETSGSIVLTP